MSRLPKTDPGDELLLERCLQHDREAWDAFVRRYSRLIYSVVHDTLDRHGCASDGDLVEDLFEAAFLALYEANYRKLRQWSRRCSLPSWIRLVTASVVVDQLRRKRPDAPGARLPDWGAVLDRERPEDTGSPLALLLAAAEAQLVRRAVATLPPSDQFLLGRLFAEDVSAPEVAAELQVKVGAVYTRKNRALGRLRLAVEEQRRIQQEDL